MWFYQRTLRHEPLRLLRLSSMQQETRRPGMSAVETAALAATLAASESLQVVAIYGSTPEMRRVIIPEWLRGGGGAGQQALFALRDAGEFPFMDLYLVRGQGLRQQRRRLPVEEQEALRQLLLRAAYDPEADEPAPDEAGMLDDLAQLLDQ